MGPMTRSTACAHVGPRAHPDLLGRPAAGLDGDGRGAWTAPPGPGGPARSSYAACQNDVEAPIDVDNHGGFYLNSRVRVVDVADGLSQTIFVGEVAVPSPLGWLSGTRATLRNTGHPINGVDLSTLELTEPAKPPLPEDLTARDLETRIEQGRLAVSPRFVGGFGRLIRGRGQLRLRRRLGAVSQADHRPLGLQAAGPSRRRGADR